MDQRRTPRVHIVAIGTRVDLRQAAGSQRSEERRSIQRMGIAREVGREDRQREPICREFGKHIERPTHDRLEVAYRSRYA